MNIEDSIAQTREIQLNMQDLEDAIASLNNYKYRLGAVWNSAEYAVIENVVNRICAKLESTKQEMEKILNDINQVTEEIIEKEEAEKEAEKESEIASGDDKEEGEKYGDNKH